MYTVYSSHDHFNENTTLSIPTNFFIRVKLINIKANTLSFFLLKTRRKQK